MAYTPVATWAFTGTNGTLPSGLTALNPADGNLQILSNQIHGTTSQVAQDARDSTNTYAADQYAEIEVHGVNGGNAGCMDEIGVILRASGDTDGGRDLYRIVLRLTDTNPSIVIAKLVNGTYTALDTTVDSGFADGDMVGARVVGNVITSYRKHAGTRTDIGTATDSSLTSGRAGFSCQQFFCDALRGDDGETGDITADGAAITGTGAATAPASTASGAGIVGRVGTGAAATPDTTTSGAGVVGRVGSGAATAPAATLSGSGSVNGASLEVTGTGALTAAAFTITGAGSRGVHDSPGPIAIASSIPIVAGSGTVSAPEGPEAVTGTGALTAGANTAAGLGIRGIHGTGACSMVIPTVRGFQVLPPGKVYQEFGFGMSMRF